MSNSKPVTTEDVNPIDTVIEIVDEFWNDLQRRFLLTVPYSSDQEMILRIVHHLRSTLIYYVFGRTPVFPAAPKGGSSKVHKEEVALFAKVNAIFDHLPDRYSPSSPSSDDEEAAGSKMVVHPRCGGPDALIPGLACSRSIGSRPRPPYASRLALTTRRSPRLRTSPCTTPMRGRSMTRRRTTSRRTTLIRSKVFR